MSNNTSARIRQLQEELNYPSAAKLRSALAKEGIAVREKDIRELLTSAQGNRQVLQPPPKYEGNITSQRMDQRWAADVISFVSDPAKDGTKTYKYVLLVQDIFSRTLWAEAMTELQETTGAFATILQRSFPRKPGELNTDKDSSFTSRQFQAMLEERGIDHRTKEAANDIATIDAAIREVRQILGRRTLREGAGNWFHELDAAISGFNRTDHGALKQPGGDGGKAPGEVADDVHLRFQLRRENAEEAIENAELIKKRADRLRDAGGFRTLLQPMSFRRRAGRPNWSEKIHTVREVVGGKVIDTDGKEHQTKLVLPVKTDSVPASFTQVREGSAQIDNQRRTAMLNFVMKLKTELGKPASKKLPTTTASRIMNDDANFRRKLREQRMTFLQFVKLFPREFLIRRRTDNKTVIALADADRNLQRLRRLPGAVDSSPTELIRLRRVSG